MRSYVVPISTPSLKRTRLMGDWWCCTYHTCSLACLVVGVVSIVVACVVPANMSHIIDRIVCDSICVPLNCNDSQVNGSWQCNNWLSTDNLTWHPPMYVEFYLYNITNVYEVVLSGAEPRLSYRGPYVFRLRQEKFNVSYNHDNSEVSFQQMDQYFFEASRSNGSLTDHFWNTNIPFVSGAWTFWTQTGSALAKLDFTLCPPPYYLEKGPLQACLFGWRNVTEILFGQFSMEIQAGNKVYYRSRPNDPIFRQFVNGSSKESWSEQSRNMRNFGLGGICNLTLPGGQHGPLQEPVCRDPSHSPGADMRYVIKTGQGGLKQLGRYVRYLGNDSIWFWNNTSSSTKWPTSRLKAQGEEDKESVNAMKIADSYGIYQGEEDKESDNAMKIADSYGIYQMSPDMGEATSIRIFNEASLRNIDFSYVGTVRDFDIELRRYITSLDTFFGSDPIFLNSNEAGYGFINVSVPALILYGAYAPVYVSQMFQAGVPQRNPGWTCLDCPMVDPTASLTDLTQKYGSWLDLQPRLGTVLRGQQQYQFNVHIGNEAIYGNADCARLSPLQKCPYGLVPEMKLPLFTFNMSTGMTADQAKLVQDGLKALQIGRIAYHAVLYTSISSGPVFFLLFGYLWYRHRQSRRFITFQTADYTKVTGGLDPDLIN
eukprot:g43000.t1